MPTVEQIEVAIKGELDLDLLYGLTSLGGSVWEEYSKADWKRYIADIYYTDPNIVEIISMDPDLTEEYFSIHVRATLKIVEESVEKDVLTPWMPVPWKSLEVGYRIQATYFEQDTFPHFTTDVDNRITEIRTWYFSPFD